MPNFSVLLQIGRYPTYQVFLVAVVALGAAVVLFPLWIRLVRYRNIGQQVRADGPQGHLVKQGTPTMGGVLIMLVVTVVYVAMGSMDRQSLLVLGAMLACALLGFVDDYAKVVKERSLGLTATAKIAWQVLISLTVGLLAVNWAGVSAVVNLPLVGGAWNLGALSSTLMVGGFAIVVPWLYVLLVALMVVAASNTVNLTDGLDGLAAGAGTFCFGVLSIIGYWQFRHFSIYRIHSALDLGLVAVALVGACLGFLWWNAAPARIMMGDTGSLAIGTGLGALCLLMNLDLLLIVLGGLFVAETASVILQVISFRLFGRRVFRMAPFHHHFELRGWPETTVIIRFWIISGLCAVMGLGIFYGDFLKIAKVV